jgi:tRNA threonylcarbamoyladenosine biosynthesis protein TsaB
VAYAGFMESFGQSGALLLLDTCGERASLAVVRSGRVVVERLLEERAASGALLGAIREALGSAGVELGALAAIGVVNGPGSFTGVRVGVAMAKGLCEALSVRLAAVSRLAVLAEAAGLRDGFAALSAGRDQVYVREVGAERNGVEWMMSAEALRGLASGREVVYAEERFVGLLGEGVGGRRVELFASRALGPVERCLAAGGSDLALVDANYVRPEEAIYRSSRVSGSAGR